MTGNPTGGSTSSVGGATASRSPHTPPKGVDEEALKRLRHDLRTPLNQIIGYTEMLVETAGESAPAALTEDLQRLNASGSQILAILNEGLAPWKFEAGKVDLVGLRRSLLGLLTSVLGYRDLCEETARAHGLEEAVSDLEKIGQAARHLRMMLDQDSFTERYALGAPIASNPTSGSPVLFPGSRTPILDPTVTVPAAGHLLVVDDEPLNREMLMRRLKRMGFTATGAENGLLALEQLTKETFDLVLLDILMPELDGFKTLERLKADEKLRHLPVIMLTALDEASSTVRCIEAGAEDYVPKPFNPVILRARITAALERKRLRDQERAYLAEIQAERAKSERLLLNILPKAIGDRLKAGEQTIVDAVVEATVMFADIVNFTGIAAKLTPEQTVAWLNEIFSDFDHLVERHGVEKVKTVGDSYMVVGGVPLPIPDHAVRCADMAMAMIESMQVFNQRNGLAWQIRIGMHTGPLVAGIIGSKKFAYDLWGDTVNIASRLESHGEPGMIQVSQATADLLTPLFVIEPRGHLALKNRGKMTAYALISRHKPLCAVKSSAAVASSPGTTRS
ncbi:MAG TPA: adenylate/guanylate cyclase domain-containing protein [Opitutaceae bacterium]|nr:adenylate/guanylate cyclase domain-containing protein [Opitutaceae bacterium]